MKAGNSRTFGFSCRRDLYTCGRADIGYSGGQVS